MNGRICALFLATLLSSFALAADDPVDGGQGDEPQITGDAAKENSTPTRKSCLRQCDAAESRCSSEVRRSRMDCSRNAATGNSRDPFSAPHDQFTMFCNYFATGSRTCGRGVYGDSCRARFEHRYRMCLDAMHTDIASLRYDCHRAERDAQQFCRAELQDCKSTCPP